MQNVSRDGFFIALFLGGLLVKTRIASSFYEQIITIIAVAYREIYSMPMIAPQLSVRLLRPRFSLGTYQARPDGRGRQYSLGIDGSG